MPVLLNHNPKIKAATFDQLKALPSVEGTSRWTPFPHSLTVERARAVLTSRGYKIDTEEHYLSTDGHRYIGALTLTSKEEARSSFSLVLRNSTDKSLAFHLLAGTTLRVCSNGVIFGDHASERQTHVLPGTDVEEAITARILGVLAKMPDILSSFSSFLRSLRETEARPRDQSIEEFVVESARENIIASQDILPVLDYFAAPGSMTTDRADLSSNDANEEYSAGSAYCLFNAYTARFRDKSAPFSLADRSKDLISLFSSTYFSRPAAPEAPVAPQITADTTPLTLAD